MYNATWTMCITAMYIIAELRVTFQRCNTYPSINNPIYIICGKGKNLLIFLIPATSMSPDWKRTETQVIASSSLDMGKTLWACSVDQLMLPWRYSIIKIFCVFVFFYTTITYTPMHFSTINSLVNLKTPLLRICLFWWSSAQHSHVTPQ